MTAKSQSRQANSTYPFPWLTVEFTLWGLLLAVALGLRLFRLGAAPLNTSEARDALFAWRFAHGGGAPAAAGYSPVLFSGQWLTFLIISANDLTARLMPALAGTALALAPVLLRTQLGRLGALAAGTLLAISPTALVLSRTASAHILTALGALLCAAGLWRFLAIPASHPAIPNNAEQKTQLPATIYLATLGFALMLSSGPLAYSAIIALVLALLGISYIDVESRQRLKNGFSVLRVTPNAGSYLLGTLAIGVILFSTAFAWHLGGLAAFADLLPQWLDGFVRWPDSLSPAYPGFILTIYEPLILLTGIAGAVLAALRGHSSSLFMALWSIVALLLALARPGHGPGDVLVVLVPLACLGGQALDTLLAGLRRWGHWLDEGLYLFISAPLWAYLVLNLSAYCRQPGQHTQINLLFVNVSLPTYLVLAVATFLLLWIAVIGIGFFREIGSALRGLSLSTTLALLLFTFATTWGVSQNRPADPRELLVLEPTAPEVRLLKDSLVRFSNERRGYAYAVDVTLLTDDPALTWALRDFQDARVAEVTESRIATMAVIAPEALGIPPLGEDYVGQSFPLRQSWNTSILACQWNMVQIGLDLVKQLDCLALAEWLVFRESPEQPTKENIVLWLRQDLASR